MGDVYDDLQEQLDQYSVFPKTSSGVERDILRRLFSQEEARMYLLMSLLPETASQVAQRIGRDLGEMEALLGGMADKGLLFRQRKPEGARYAAAPYVVGVYEFQVKDMDREFARLNEQYFEEAFGEQATRQFSLMRPIPVNRSIAVGWPVAPYDQAWEILKDKTLIAVADCICRKQQKLLDQGCGKPREVCFMFGSHARYYIDRGMGREVSREEAFKILEACEEAGLVLQPFNAQNPGGMCNCCGDCCAMLRALKKHPFPARMTLSNYYAEVDPEECVACEACVERCQMDAVQVGEKGVAEVDLNRCIGCGLCVTTCPTGAVALHMKPEEERQVPCVSGKETFMQMAQIRGKSLIPLVFLSGKH